MPAKKKTVTAAELEQTGKQKALKVAEPDQAAVSPEPAGTSGENRRRMISEAAYFRALERGFEGGDPEHDWYAAEADIRKVFREM